MTQKEASALQRALTRFYSHNKIGRKEGHAPQSKSTNTYVSASLSDAFGQTHGVGTGVDLRTRRRRMVYSGWSSIMGANGLTISCAPGPIPKSRHDLCSLILLPSIGKLQTCQDRSPAWHKHGPTAPSTQYLASFRQQHSYLSTQMRSPDDLSLLSDCRLASTTVLPTPSQTP